MLVINCRLQWMAESGSETGDDDWMLSDDEDWEAVAKAAEAGGGERADEQRGEHSGDDSDDSDDSSERGGGRGVAREGWGEPVELVIRDALGGRENDG